jgi:hypothetical protein
MIYNDKTPRGRAPPKAEVGGSNPLGSAIDIKHLATISDRLKPVKTERNELLLTRC